jgi:hypothetical protein
MHFSRKRYRPLDSAEERAVHVNQRVQVLPLEDEQSYCFSWPDAPLTQWLRENTTYATLHQLTAGSNSGSNPSTGSSTARDTTGLTDALASGNRGEVEDRRDGPAHHVASSSSVSASSLARRQVDLPPVFTLNDTVGSLSLSSPLKNRSSPFPAAAAVSSPPGGDDVHTLLHLLQHDIEAVDREAALASSTNCGYSTGRGPESASDTVTRTDNARAATAASSASIIIPADTRRAMPHPFAPARPQSITEDSIFTLSASQLADLARAGVPALCRAQDAMQKEQQPQQTSMADAGLGATEAQGEPTRDVALQGAEEKEEEEAPLPPSSTQAVVVIVEDKVEEGEEETRADVRGKSDVDGTASPSSCSLHAHGGQTSQLRCCLPASHRRAVEDEVVGLEWRTWTQSQRTAAALQRLLSLEAAVPFEPCGDARRDAWRAVVYRLWLQWRQQIPHESGKATAAPSSVCFSGFTTAATAPPTPQVASVSPLMTATPSSPLPPQQQPYMLPRRLPWGTPLLAGAYLYGTSNDYFISLPAAATSSSGTGGGGTASTTTTPASPSSMVGGGAGGASVWPAMSRRRGAYNFLRWRVELYEAQMPHLADGANDVDDEDHDGGNVDDFDDKAEEGVAVVDVAGEEGEWEEKGDDTDDAPPRKANKYAKGPLSLQDTFASGRPKRRGVSGSAGGGGDDASPATFPPPSSLARRSSSSRVAAAPTSSRPVPQHSLNTLMSAAHIRALIQSIVLTQPLTDLQMDDEASAVMERLACPDLRCETDAWRVWLSKV